MTKQKRGDCMSVQDRFLRYVSIDTQSDPESPTAPSTMKQLDLARLLKEEMEEMGLSDVYLSDTGVVYGTLKADQPAGLEAIGLIAHMDTAKEMPGKDVKPRVIHAWDGNKIQLNEKWSMTKEAFPALNDVVGDDTVVTDGTTLLGADDKAGIAIILETVQQMAKESGRKRDIYVAFTPDEEIGRGVENFELDRFPVEFAYTLDGGEVHGVEYETFNAAGAKITIQGASVHPGSAKDKMVNAALIGAEYAMMMPGYMTPAHTEGREGFIHLISIEGDCEHAALEYILRDHDKEGLKAKKAILEQAAAMIRTLYGNVIDVNIYDQYENMKDYMHGDFRAVNKACEALRACGLEPVSLPVRGGTDGAVLTAKGLITPNLGTGGGNYHGRFEFVSVNKMEKMMDVLRHIIEE